jgi:hypothetical protein
MIARPDPHDKIPMDLPCPTFLVSRQGGEANSEPATLHTGVRGVRVNHPKEKVEGFKAWINESFAIEVRFLLGNIDNHACRSNHCLTA